MVDSWYNAEDTSDATTPAQAIPTDTPPSWGDYAKQPLIGALGVLSGAQSGLSYIDNKLGNTDSAQLGALQAQDTRDATKGLQDSMTPGGQQVMGSSILAHPVRGLVMRGLQMAPAVAAAAIPGGVVSDILGGTAGAITAAGTNAAMSGGQFADSVAASIDNVPDDELRKQSPTYDELRTTMEKQDALDHYRDYLTDGQGRMALVLLGGAVGGGLGIGGKLASGSTGKALGSAAEAGLAGGFQAGTTDAAYQTAMVQGGFQSHGDVQEWAKQVFDNMVVGGVAGGAHGFGGHDTAPAKVETTATVAPDAAQSEALKAAVPQPEPPAPPAPSAQNTSKTPPAPPVAPTPAPAPEARPAPPVPQDGTTQQATPAPTPAPGPATDAAVPESPATLQAQLNELTTAKRSVMVVKAGEQMPTKNLSALGLTKLVVPTPNGPDTYLYNRQSVAPGDLRKAIMDGSVGEKYLGLGPVTKDQAVVSEAAGSPPVAVTERAPDGTEVKAAAGTEETAPTQVNAIAAQASPGNTVGVENAANLIAERQAANGVQAPPPTNPLRTISPDARAAAEASAARISATFSKGRVLADVSPRGIDESAQDAADNAATVKSNLAAGQKQDAVDAADGKSQGKHYSQKEILAKKDTLDAHRQIMLANPPDPRAEDLGTQGRAPAKGAYNAIKERAGAMVASAKAEGLSATVSAKHNSALADDRELAAHKDLLRLARSISQKKNPDPMDLAEFQMRDRAIREGKVDAIGDLARGQIEVGGLGSVGMEGAKEGVSQDAGHGELEGDIPHAEPDETMSEHNRDDAPKEATSEEENIADENNQESDDVFRPEQTAPANENRGTAEDGGDPGATFESSGFGSRAGKFVVAKTRRSISVSPKVAKMAAGDDWNIPVTKHGVTHSLPVEATGKLADVLSDIRPEDDVFLSDFAPELATRLSRAIGDMDVHVVSQAAIDRVFGPGSRVRGFYDSTQDHIVLSSETSPDIQQHVMLHEAVHGALYHAINNDPRARADIQSLMQEFKRSNVGLGDQYAYLNEHEFVSEVLANPDLRDAAASTPISPALAARLGISGRAANLWGGVLAAVRRALGLPPKFTTTLDGVMSVAERNGVGGTSDPSFKQRGMQATKDSTLPAITTDALDQEASNPRSSAVSKEKLLSSVSDKIAPVKSWGSELWNKNAFNFMSSDNLRQAKEHLFGPKNETNPVRRLVDATEKANTYMRKLLQPADQLAGDLWRAAKKYNKGPEWDKFAGLINDSTIYDVHPDEALDSPANAHLRLGKEAQDESDGAMSVWQSRAKHPELQETFRSLPQDLQELYQRARDYYAGQRDARVRQHIGSVIEGHDAPEGSTVEEAKDRIFNGKMTDEDSAHYDQFGIGKTLKAARDLQKTTGPYFPLKRRGDYVVQGEHEIAAPSNATRVKGTSNQFDFDTRDAAHDFATKQSLPAKARKVYFDPETGEETSKLGGLSTEGTSIEKHRITVQSKHVQFAKTEAEAREIKVAMEKAGIKNVTEPDLVSKNPGVDYGLHSSQLSHLLAAVGRRDDLSAADKDRLTQSLSQASVALQRGNRLESHFLPRKNVAGASTDVITNLSDYAHASAAFRSRAEFKDGIDGSLKEMRQVKDANRMSPDTAERSRVIQEYERRMNGFGSPEYQGKLAPMWSRLMALSFLKRMASPAHLALHMMHPVMTSIPIIGGQRGYIRTQREFLRAYKDMGGVGAIGEGVKGLVRVARDNTGPTNFGNYFRAQLSNAGDREALGSMMKELEATGHLHPDSGFDVARYNNQKGTVDRGLERVDHSFRELTSATESVNRYATAIAAYRLSLKDGESHEQAVRYAKDTVANTQGLYSATNAAPIFRNPATKPFLQFKQYPAMIIHLIGKMTYDAFKGDTPEVKQAAVRSLGMMLGTAAVLTGVNGLPTEPAKLVALVGNAFGVTPSWDQVENDMRLGLAHQLGPQLGNLVMNGVSSLGPTAVDVHHRLGFSSMLTFGEPSSAKPDDVQNWLAGVIGGAPLSMMTDTLTGAQALRNGDYEQAFEKLTPVKALDDLAKAGRLMTQGKPTPSGKPGMRPLDLPEGVVQALGFTPRSVADYGEARFNAGRDIRGLPVQKPRAGNKPETLGIARSRRNAPILNDYSESYGIDQ